MRYRHNIRIIRKRKHVLTVSLVVTCLIIVLIAVLGVKTLNVDLFFVGFLRSLGRVIFSYVISLILAVGLTIFVSSSKQVEEFSLPILDVLQSFPSFALFPLLVAWFGKTPAVTIFILVVSMIWPMLFTLITAQKQLKEDMLEASKIYGATGTKFLRFVLLPELFPAIVTGSIVAWGEAWETVIAAEIIVSVSGVGTYLADAGNAGQNNVLIVGILLLLLMLYIMNKYVWLSLLDKSTRYQNG